MGPKRGAASSPKAKGPAKKAKAEPAKKAKAEPAKKAKAEPAKKAKAEPAKRGSRVLKVPPGQDLDLASNDSFAGSDDSLAFWSEEEVEMLTADAEEQAKNEMFLHVVDKRGPPLKKGKGTGGTMSTLADIGPAPKAEELLARGLEGGGLREEVEAEEEAVMQWLISPVSVESFWHQVWQHRVLLVTRNAHNPGMYEGLLTSAECRSLLAKQKGLEYGRHVQLLSCEDGVFEEQVSEPDAAEDDIGLAKASTVWSKYAKGAIVRVLRPQRTVESLWRLLARLEDATRCTLDCTAVMVPPRSAGLPPRCEESDVFILQLEGVAHWLVDGPNSVEEVLPLEGADFDPEDSDSGDESDGNVDAFKFDVNLKPGDLLYLPRGFTHRSNTEGSIKEGSMHLVISGFSAQGGTWGDLIKVALTQAVDSATEKYPTMRMSVPPGLFRTLGALHDDVDSDSDYSDESDVEEAEDEGGPSTRVAEKAGKGDARAGTIERGEISSEDDDDGVIDLDELKAFHNTGILTGTKRNEARTALADDLEERLDMVLDELDFDGAADNMAASFQVHRLPPPGFSKPAASGKGEGAGKGKGKKSTAAAGALEGSSVVVGIPSSYWTMAIEGERLMVYHCLGTSRENHAEVPTPAMLDEEYMPYGDREHMLTDAVIVFPLDVALLVESLMRSGSDGEKPKTVEECGEDAADAEDLEEDELMLSAGGSDGDGGGGDASEGGSYDSHDDDGVAPGVAAELVRLCAVPVAQFLFDAGLLRLAQ